MHARRSRRAACRALPSRSRPTPTTRPGRRTAPPPPRRRWRRWVATRRRPVRGPRCLQAAHLRSSRPVHPDRRPVSPDPRLVPLVLRGCGPPVLLEHRLVLQWGRRWARGRRCLPDRPVLPARLPCRPARQRCGPPPVARRLLPGRHRLHRVRTDPRLLPVHRQVRRPTPHRLRRHLVPVPTRASPPRPRPHPPLA